MWMQHTVFLRVSNFIDVIISRIEPFTIFSTFLMEDIHNLDVKLFLSVFTILNVCEIPPDQQRLIVAVNN